MVSKLARLVFNDSYNGSYFCAFIIFLTALYLQKLNWWILVIYVVSLFLTALIGAILFDNSDDVNKKEQARKKQGFMFGSYKMNLAFFFFGLLLCLPINYFFDLNHYNFVLTAVVYVLIFSILHHNFWEKHNSA